MKCDLCDTIDDKAMGSSKYPDLKLCKGCFESLESSSKEKQKKILRPIKIKKWLARGFLGLLSAVGIAFVLYCLWFAHFGPDDNDLNYTHFVPKIVGIMTTMILVCVIVCYCIKLLFDVIDIATKDDDK